MLATARVPGESEEERTVKHELMVSIFGVLAAGATMSASAQTCAAPEAWRPPPAGDARAVDTCNGDDSGAALMCGGTQDRVGPVYVFRTTFAPQRTFTTVTISGGGAGFDPVMFMTPAAGGCGANQETCNPSGDTGFPIASADVPDGDWLILVTAFGQNAPGTCGPVALSSNGSSPVTLTGFTID
jgi:hypothetical protein